MPTDVKLRMVERLLAAGIREIEVTSFAHPGVVPQLADAEDLMRRLARPPGVRYRAVVPNAKGAHRAVTAGCEEIAGFVSASETYSRKNQNMTIEEALAEIEAIAEVARDAGLPWSAAVAMAFFSPFEGPIPAENVLRLVSHLAGLGAEAVTLAATAGMATPGEVASLCSAVRQRWPELALGVHLHNTNGMGLASALAAIDAGVTMVDASICGIGGPVVAEAATPSPGNIATEDLVWMLEGLDVDTGIDRADAVKASREIADLLGVEQMGFLARHGTPDEVVGGRAGT